MVILAKQIPNSSRVCVKQFENVADAASYLKVHQTNIYKATGKHNNGKPYRVKGWYVDIEKD